MYLYFLRGGGCIRNVYLVNRLQYFLQVISALKDYSNESTLYPVLNDFRKGLAFWKVPGQPPICPSSKSSM
jgi:hypothetical protein